MKEDFIVSDLLREHLSVDNARFVLSRADMLVNSTLEQLRKSTDRAYTLFGLLVTAFSGLTVFVLSVHSIRLLIPLVVLWLGLSCCLYMLFSRAIWIHPYRDAGNSPENMLVEKNVVYLKKKHKGLYEALNKEYMLNALYDSIEDSAYAIRVNDLQLAKRSRDIELVMKILKVTLGATALSSIICLFFTLFI